MPPTGGVPGVLVAVGVDVPCCTTVPGVAVGVTGVFVGVLQ